MKKIYIVGDIHTVSAFRLSGIKGIVCSREEAPSRLEQLIEMGDAAIIVITHELAENLQLRIADINLGMQPPAVIQIPGIDDTLEFRSSVLDYIAEALGMHL